MTEYNIRLNPNCAAAVHTGLKFKAGDKGITFKIAVDELDTTGTTAKIVFLRANGTSVESDISGTNGVYTYKTLGNEFAVPGKTVADVKFYAADARVSTASFVFEVSGDTMDGLGAGAGGYSDRLEQLATEAEDAMKNAENVSKELENLLTVYQNKFGEVGVLNPKGTYNNAITYEAFDLVYDGGVSWLCLQRCTGVTPAEGAYWQLFASADGGNAAKLGGKGASEYALDTDLANYLPKSDGTISGSLKFKTVDNGWTEMTKAHGSDFDNGTAIYDYDSTGGYVALVLQRANGLLRYYDDYGGKDILHTGNYSDYALPNSGGTVQNATQTPLTVRQTTNGALNSFIAYHGSSSDGTPASLGSLGFADEDLPAWIKKDGSAYYPLLHTGNKPTGGYTGNGSATQRTISTGGIGSAIYVEETYGTYFALVLNGGAIVVDRETKAITAITDAEFNSQKGLQLFTTHVALNQSGSTYRYYVL